jgi:hypothetical protein
MQVSQHGMDLGMMAFEFCLNRVLFPLSHILLVLLTLVLYIFWSWIGAAIFPEGGPKGYDSISVDHQLF